MENRSNTIPDEKLEKVSGGSYIAGSDGNLYEAVGIYGSCSQYHCRGCGGSLGAHKDRCRTEESRRDMCISCYYFEALEVNGCCRR